MNDMAENLFLSQTEQYRTVSPSFPFRLRPSAAVLLSTSNVKKTRMSISIISSQSILYINKYIINNIDDDEDDNDSSDGEDGLVEILVPGRKSFSSN